MDHEDARAVPIAVKVVAWYFIGCGVLGCLRIIIAAAKGVFDVDVSAPGVLVGLGLLGLSRTWRFIGVFMLGMTIGAAPVVLLTAMARAQAIHRTFFGVPTASFQMSITDVTSFEFHWPLLGFPSPGFGAIEPVVAIALWGFLIWQLRVLTRPETRAIFQRVWPPAR